MKPPGKIGSVKREPRDTPAWAALSPTELRKATERICIESHCRNFIPRSSRLFRCYTCRSREYAEKNPIRVKWLNLKKSAKRRGHEWQLDDFPRFEAWAMAHGYTAFGPLGAAGLTVDRKEETGPYSFENIQTMTNSENAIKAADNRRASFCPWYQYHTGADCPF